MLGFWLQKWVGRLLSHDLLSVFYSDAPMYRLSQNLAQGARNTFTENKIRKEFARKTKKLKKRGKYATGNQQEAFDTVSLRNIPTAKLSICLLALSRDIF